MSKLLTGKPVLVPWDFSETSLWALSNAISLVGSTEPVKVVHVGQIPVSAEPGMIWGAVTEDMIVKNAEQHFQATLAKHPEFAGVDFKTMFGDPGLTITDHAKEIGAELIVIASHGRTGISRLLLGSVAERVVRFAHCPVLVLRDARTTNDPSLLQS